MWGKTGVAPEPRRRLPTGARRRGVESRAGGLLVPIAGRSPTWGLGHDALVVVGLLALGRVAITAAAWDTGSGFALMGAGRDLTFAVFAEGVLVLVVLLAAIVAGGSTDLIAMSDAAAGSHVWSEPLHWCAGLAFALVALAETGRQPVDNPDTHLELTMVHEGPLLEYAGRDLACLQWAAAARLWVMTLLAAELFLPKGGSFAVRLAALAGAAVVICAALAVAETSLAKMRILRVPLFLGGGAALCIIGLASWLAGVGRERPLLWALVGLGLGVIVVRRRSRDHAAGRAIAAARRRRTPRRDQRTHWAPGRRRGSCGAG